LVILEWLACTSVSSFSHIWEKPSLIKLSVDSFTLGLWLFSSGKKESQVFPLIEPLHLDITSNKKHICIEIQHYVTKTDSSPFISSK